MKIKFYGCRGSLPFSGGGNAKYGGNTSCVRIDSGGRTIIIDCGSGLAKYADEVHDVPCLTLDILLTHLHIDHIIGLPTLRQLYHDGNNIRIFTKSRGGGTSIAGQAFGIYKPPYWPVSLEDMCLAKMVEVGAESFTLTDDITVTPFAASHPDDTTVFRVEAEGKSVVYLHDHEFDEDICETDNLVGYCKNADLVICDCTYLPEDFPKKRGWGHSHYRAAIKLAELSDCRRMIFSHLSYEYTDDKLDSESGVLDGKYSFACDGMEVMI